jgi:tetratricopeptide (TPR) repeat protein
MLNRAAEYRPNESALYVSQAYIYRVLGQVDEQQRALERVIELGKEYQTSENWLPALYNSGVAYETLENYQAALREYMAILQKDPTFFSAHLSAGRILIRLGRLEEAMQMYQQAQPLVKENPAREIWLSLDSGRLYELLGQPEEAVAAYTRASALNPELMTPYFYLARLYEKAGSNDAAFVNYRKLIDVSYDPGWAHAIFGEFLYKIGDYHGAIEQYLQALRHAMYDPSLTYTHLGRAYAAAGEKAPAVAAFEDALRNPGANAAYIHSLYANVLVQFGQIEEAILHYEESLQLNQGIAFETKLNLARQYEQLAEFDRARVLVESLISVSDQLSDEQLKMVQERLRALAERQP